MGELPELGQHEVRVLGCLLEKQITVPGSYPLTLNGLRSACNQSSSRDPVLDLDEREVETAARALRELGLVRVGWADTGRRTRKFSQTAVEALHLDDDERALITVLLLRGPQTPGELNARTERLHHFADRDEVEVCLRKLAERELPLVRQLERRPGQHDQRWIHLLGPSPEVSTDSSGSGSGADSSGASAAQRESVIADGSAARDDRVRTSYGAVAADYGVAFADELQDKPFERWLLDRIAECAGRRPVVEVGSGTGTVSAYLAAAGAEVTGLDLTPEMVEQARALHPHLAFEVGDLFSLMRPAAADGWGAVVAWYSLIHLAPSELPQALAALSRPLAPGGVLALALHAGHHHQRIDKWFDHDVALDVVMYEPDEVVAQLRSIGLTEIEWYRRGPSEAHGETTERLYLLASRASD